MIIIPLGLLTECCRRQRSEDTQVIIHSGVGADVELQEQQTQVERPKRELNQRAFHVIGIISIVCALLAVAAQIVGYVKADDVTELDGRYGPSTTTTTTTTHDKWSFRFTTFPSRIYHDENNNDESGSVGPYRAGGNFESWFCFVGGVIFLATGILSVLTGRYKSSGLVISTMVMSIISQVVSYILIIMWAVSVSLYQTHYRSLFYFGPRITVQHDYAAKVCVAMAAIELAVSITMAVVTLIISIFSCKSYSGCCCGEGYPGRVISRTVVTHPANTVPITGPGCVQTSVYGPGTTISQVHCNPQVVQTYPATRLNYYQQNMANPAPPVMAPQAVAPPPYTPPTKH